VSSEADRSPVRFEPLRPASRRRLVVGLILGPIFWVIALVVASIVWEHSWAIPVGILVTVACFAVSLVVLSLLYKARRRQEREYERR
jgi:membrane protein implicated in regulation of membrane protease activity